MKEIVREIRSHFITRVVETTPPTSYCGASFVTKTVAAGCSRRHSQVERQRKAFQLIVVAAVQSSCKLGGADQELSVLLWPRFVGLL